MVGALRAEFGGCRRETTRTSSVNMRVVGLPSPPRRYGHLMRRIEHQRLAGFEAMRYQNLLRRAGRDAGKAGLSVGQSHMGGLRQPKSVVAVHEHAEHAGPADDSYGTRTDPGSFADGLERRARRIP